jgi:hypothetical protein
MYADPFVLQKYDLVKGLEFVALWVMVVFCIVLFFSFRAQYRLMNTYDALSSFNPSPDRRAQVMLAHVKRLLFSVLGYQGEERERQTLDELNEKWIWKNRGRILIRFCVFYFVYIWALILTTRALLIDPATGEVHVLAYTSKQIFGFFMIGVYILTNSFCDIATIYFTTKHLDQLKLNPRLSTAAVTLIKNLGYSFVFFLLSQLVSNLIWPLKTNVNIPVLDRLFSPAIALWPYAFILDANLSSPQYFRPIFPGQLLITGTVFLPTLIIALIFVFSVLSIEAVGLLKNKLVAYNIPVYRVQVTASPGQRQPALDFSCINAFTIGISSSLVAAFIFEWIKLI